MTSLVEAMGAAGTRARPEPLAGPLEVALRKACTVLWVGVLPLLLAALVLKFFVPVRASGPGAVLVDLAKHTRVPFGAVLFLGFSAIARYWRFHLPGGRYASPLPSYVAGAERDPGRLRAWAAAAELSDVLSSRAMRRRLHSLAPAAQAAVEARFVDLRSGLASGSWEGMRRAEADLRKLASAPLAGRRRQEALTSVAALAMAVAAVFAVRHFAVQSYRVLSESMLPTLEKDDLVAGRKLGRWSAASRTPQRGDVIAFASSAVDLAIPAGRGLPDVLVKRVIGLPGDRITMDGGVPVINGWTVPSCVAGAYTYLSPEGEGRMVHAAVLVEFLEDRTYLTLASLPIPEFHQTFVVPPGEVFVLGDNRGNSLDSRAYHDRRGGGVPFDAIIARAEWFLVGTGRGGDADWSRLLRRMDRLESSVHLQGISSGGLEKRIRKCLDNRPPDTRPPAPDDAPKGVPMDGRP